MKKLPTPTKPRQSKAPRPISRHAPSRLQNGRGGGRVVQVALTQMACGPDAKANLDRQIRLLDEAARQGGQILCTQELFRSQYFCQLEDHRFFKLAETIPGPSTDALGKLARKHNAVIVASLFEKLEDEKIGDIFN